MDSSDKFKRYKRVADNIIESINLLEEDKNADKINADEIDYSKLLQILEPMGGKEFGIKILRLMDGKMDSWNEVFSVMKKNFVTNKNEASTSKIHNVEKSEKGNIFRK